jgi:hypothetical protein
MYPDTSDPPICAAIIPILSLQYPDVRFEFKFEPKHPYKFFLFVIVSKAVERFATPHPAKTAKVILQSFLNAFRPFENVAMNKRQSLTLWRHQNFIIDREDIRSDQDWYFYTATHAVPL